MTTESDSSFPVDPDDVLPFWFEQTTPKQWFSKSAAFDEVIAKRFTSVVALALEGRLSGCEDGALGCLAGILILDQFTIHIYRDELGAFAGDSRALELSKLAVDSDWVKSSAEHSHRQFFLMPMMHSEDVLVQQASLPLFERYTDPDTLWFAQKHCQVIEQFGRFPHRNAILGRASTPAELQFLEQPGSSF